MFTLRLKLAAAVMICILAFGAYVVGHSVSALEADRVDAAQRELYGMARSFNSSFRADIASHVVADAQAALVALRQQNAELISASIFARRGGLPERVAYSSAQPEDAPVEEDDVAPLVTGQPMYRENVIDGQSTAELNYPLGTYARPEAVLDLRLNLHEIKTGLTRQSNHLLAMGALAALLTGLIVFLCLEHVLVGPLRRLGDAARDIGRGRTLTRLHWRRRDELGDLAAEFDRMAEAVYERERLEALALRDSLTGLSNHRHFHETLDAELVRAQSFAAPVALILLDLDHFKIINDEHGHPVGDEVLRAVAAVLLKHVRTTDAVARLGGEEFAILLPGADPESASAMAEQLRQAVAALRPAVGVAVRCSAGVAAYPTHALDVASLIEFADGALYWAKQAGRNQIRVYDPHKVSTSISTQRRAEIMDVLQDPAGIVPEFQAIVHLRTGTIAGYEALARFPSCQPTRTPDVWVAEAHRCGLGADLEAHAIRAALTIARPRQTFVSVNVSPSVVAAPAILDALALDLRNVVVELTEHESLTDHIDALEGVLRELRARGARIAVDDAGAGYAGLQQLMRLRPDIIKLDRELVTGVHGDAARAALIECFVTFARRTGAEVCAEGIEDLADLTAVAALGVDYVQGYLLAPPGPPWPELNRKLAGWLGSDRGSAVARGDASGLVDALLGTR